MTESRMAEAAPLSARSEGEATPASRSRTERSKAGGTIDLVASDGDYGLPTSPGWRLQRAVPSTRTVILEGCGHLVMVEPPQTLTRYLIAFRFPVQSPVPSATAASCLRRLIEPGLTAAQARERAKGHNEEAFAQALTGLPAVIVWEAEKASHGSGGAG